MDVGISGVTQIKIMLLKVEYNPKQFIKWYKDFKAKVLKINLKILLFENVLYLNLLRHDYKSIGGYDIKNLLI